MKPNIVLPLILLLALILRVPGWFTQDEKTKSTLFRQKEFHQVEAAALTIKRWDRRLLNDWDTEAAVLRERGFGVQTALIGYVFHKVGGMALSTANLLLIARILSTVYSLLTILVVYRITFYLFRSQLAALQGASLTALFDHNVIFGHHGLPQVAYAFWSYFAIFLMIIFYDHFRGRKPAKNPTWGLMMAIPLTVGAAFATQFDFAPLAVAIVLLILLTLRSKLNQRALLGHTSSLIILSALFFLIFTVFQFNPGEIDRAFVSIYRENYVLHSGKGHLLLNPIAYALAIIGGTGLPVIIVVAITLFALLRRGKTFPGYTGLLILLLFLGLEFIAYWNMDTPLVRRMAIFMPFIAIIGGRGLAGVLMGEPDRAAWQRYGATIFVLAYTLLLTLVSQSNTWNDTRYQTRLFLNEQHADGKINYSPFARASQMPEGLPLSEAGLLVAHETYYGRFWKSFASPFLFPPQCCEKGGDCLEGKDQCEFYQALLSGKHPDWEPARTFNTREILPERKLFKRLFGTYDEGVGDVMIFQRIAR